MNVKVLIVDDHPFTRAGIRTILEAKKETVEITGEAKDGLDAIRQVKVYQPNIVVMDITMPQLSGIDATREILKEHPDTKIIALSIHSGEKFVKEMLDAGAVGYLLKDEAPEELFNAIEKIIKGDLYLSSGVTRAALKKVDFDQTETGRMVLNAKLTRPSLISDYLLRTKIIDELESNIAKPFSLTSAGAGYGKSVAISQWLEQTNRIHAWISLDEEHNDIRIFLSYLVTAISKVVPGSMIETGKAISGVELPSFKDLIYILLIDLCEIEEEMVLVLDDYHKIHEDKIHQVFSEWLRFPPPNIHLSIIVRRDPPIEMKALRLSGRMTEIRMDTLSFTKEEIVELFSKILEINLSEKDVKILQHKTEGWIIALRLVSMVIKDTQDVEKILDSMEGGLSTISEYLVYEVLSRLPKKVQDTLMVSSILNRFCVDLLDDICANDKYIKGREFIEWIDKANVFIVDLNIERKWFRYHRLFQDFLKDELKKQYSEVEITKYYLKAGQWFERHGFLEEALEYLLIVNDYDQASDIIKKYRLELLNGNNYNRLERLQRMIPISIIESDPELILVELYIQWYNGNFIQLGELEEKMNRFVEGLHKDSYIRDEFLFFAGFNSLFLKGDLPSALNNFESAMKQIPETASEPRGLLELHYMIFNQLVGKYHKVRQMFYELIEKELEPIRKNRIFHGFFAASLDQAEIHEVESNYLSSISYARKSKMKDALGNILYMTGSMMIRKGYWNNAIEYYDEVLNMRYIVHSRVVIDSLTALIIIHCMMNEKSKSEEVINLLDKYTSDLGDFFNTFMWSTRIRYHMINSDHEAVKDLLPEYKPVVLDLVLWLDIPEITHARALIFEGSTESLEMAEEELAKLERLTNELQNRVHIFEVKVLQAILFDKKGNRDKAIEALLSSIKISEPEGMISYYVELGELFTSLIGHMPDNISNTPFIGRIKKEIKNRSNKKIIRTTAVAKDKLNIVSSRELDVLKCISEGLRNQEIAIKLFISEETVKKHIYNMFQKLDVKNRLSLVSRAKEKGILT